MGVEGRIGEVGFEADLTHVFPVRVIPFGPPFLLDVVGLEGVLHTVGLLLGGLKHYNPHF